MKRWHAVTHISEAKICFKCLAAFRVGNKSSVQNLSHEYEKAYG
jgi:hypothetical protein